MFTARLGAAALAVTLMSASPARAGAEDYEFTAAAEVTRAPGIEVAVRLVHKPTGKPIADAVIFRTRLDMGPDGMGTMTAPLTPAPSTEPGTYRFRAELAMSGRWALRLMGKVQGEIETVQGRVVFTAKDGGAR